MDSQVSLQPTTVTTVTEMANETGYGTYVLNAENQWGWITLYVVTIVIAVLGNLLFVVASLCTKRTRTTGEEERWSHLFSIGTCTCSQCRTFTLRTVIERCVQFVGTGVTSLFHARNHFYSDVCQVPWSRHQAQLVDQASSGHSCALKRPSTLKLHWTGMSSPRIKDHARAGQSAVGSKSKLFALSVPNSSLRMWTFQQTLVGCKNVQMNATTFCNFWRTTQAVQPCHSAKLDFKEQLNVRCKEIDTEIALAPLTGIHVQASPPHLFTPFALHEEQKILIVQQKGLRSTERKEGGDKRACVLACVSACAMPMTILANSRWLVRRSLWYRLLSLSLSLYGEIAGMKKWDLTALDQTDQ